MIKNILLIKPSSIAGALIINGLAKGFQGLGYNVLALDIREMDILESNIFFPDIIIGYDYAHLYQKQAEKIIKGFNKPIIHYFADNPDSNFAYSGDTTLPERLAKTEGIVFCWDREYLKSFRNKALYLPLAADQALYKTTRKIEKTIDISFIGRPLTSKRQELLAEVIKEYPDSLKIYCYKAHFEKSIEEIKQQNLLSGEFLNKYINSWAGFLRTEEELSRIYRQSKICLNITEQGVGGLNYRIFEVLASESFLLTDFMTDISFFFDENIHLSCYRDKKEMIEKITFYLQNEELREEAARKGRDLLFEKHTFKHRAQEMIRLLKAENLI